MGLLDSDTVIVDAILTKLGRDKLRQGQPLGITQYAFGDTGVDYSLYNPNHPSGSDSYGSAINFTTVRSQTDDDVFLRSKLYGDGERGIQNFAFIDLPDTTRTIQHIPQGIVYRKLHREFILLVQKYLTYLIGLPFLTIGDW